MSATESSVYEHIDRWCKRNLATGCTGVSEERLDELKDHLLCVAEAHIEQGAEPEEAARLAIEQFGDPADVRDQLAGPTTTFRRWIAGVHCRRRSGHDRSGRNVILMSLAVAAALLLLSWLAQDDRTYAILSTGLIGVWVVLAGAMGGTREAARAEWRWLKSKFGG